MKALSKRPRPDEWDDYDSDDDYPDCIDDKTLRELLDKHSRIVDQAEDR